MGPNARLRRRVTILAALGTLAVTIGVSLLLGNTIALRDNAASTLGADRYLLQTVAVERLAVDAETGLRGYVITRRPLFLAPLYASEAQLPGTLAALMAEARANRAFAPEAGALVAATRSYFGGYLPRVLNLVMANPSFARSVRVTADGKGAVDSIRARAANLERLVSASQTARQKQARGSADHSIVEAIVVLGLLTMLTALVGGLLGRLAVERERARERSELTTQSLQQSILPAQVPPVPGCQLAVRFTPAGDGVVGGDFYDVFETADGRWALVVGDVCGKGADAAAVSAMARWTLRSLAGSITTPADALRFLNQVMLRQDLGGRFVTIALLLVSLDGPLASVEIACAGHPAPVCVPASGAPVVVAAEGDLLGIWPDIRLHPAEMQLGAGDGLVIYTDGVTDQGPGALPSPEATLGDRPPDADAAHLASMLEALALTPGQAQRDDIAVLALRFLGDGQAAEDRLSLSGSRAVSGRS